MAQYYIVVGLVTMFVLGIMVGMSISDYKNKKR